MQWTPERVEMLTRLWAKGLSARQIAAKLGGITRNAVIGKAHRLNLQRGAPVAQPQPVPPPVIREEPPQILSPDVLQKANCTYILSLPDSNHLVTSAKVRGVVRRHLCV